MRIYERIDNLNRMCGFFITDEEPTYVSQTHTMCYMGAREMMKDLGIVMGLDNTKYFEWKYENG